MCFAKDWCPEPKTFLGVYFFKGSVAGSMRVKGRV